MTKVAYLVSDYAAPSHTFVRREADAVRALGIDVTPISIQAGGSGDDEVESLLGRSPLTYLMVLAWALFHAPIRFFSAWHLAIRHRAPGFRALLWSQFHFIEALMLAKLVARDKIARLHVHFANSGATVGLIGAHYANIPFSLTLHGISETDFPAGLLLGAKVERADFVACASHFMRAQGLRQVDPVHWNKFHIVRCGVDASLLDKPSVEADAARVHMICVGRLSPEKGYYGLFAALRNLAKGGIDFKLTVVGDGPIGDQLRLSLAGTELDGRVEFVGYLAEADTLAAIERADILVLASLMEGLPAVLIEALALGKPVVAPHIAGIPELVEDGQNGLMFTPSDWGDLERALHTMVTSSDDWHKWGKNGRSRVDEEFLITTAASRMANLFRGNGPQ
ncbi:MAG: glycosyltransferase family 4 protein [Pontixanthobacter sp.]